MRRAIVCTAAVLMFVATDIVAQTTSTVTVATKTAAHPYFGQGSAEGFVVDGVEGKEVIVMRGSTHTFQLSGVPEFHPFYISTSETGAGAGVYSEGVSGNMATGNATVTFTPSASTPDLLYYQCGNHPNMGWRIVVQGAVSSIQQSIERQGAAIVAWPNPADDRTTIALRSDVSRSVRIVIYDELGRAVGEPVKTELTAGDQRSVSLDLSTLAPGAYVVHASGTGVSVAVPIAVQR
jgi:hypothetical protein